MKLGKLNQKWDLGRLSYNHLSGVELIFRRLHLRGCLHVWYDKSYFFTKKLFFYIEIFNLKSGYEQEFKVESDPLLNIPYMLCIRINQNLNTNIVHQQKKMTNLS